ncbi:MAG: hypothetical protein ABDH28_00840 [Brevinematia bacterium]
MAIDKIVKIVEEEVEKEISQILSSAMEEREKILKDAKSKIDEEIETQKRAIHEEYHRKLTLEKLFIDSEMNKMINKTTSKVFRAIYSEVVKEIKSKFSSFQDQRSLLLSIIDKSLSALSLDSSKGRVAIILSPEDYKKHKDEIIKELESRNWLVEVLEGNIEGGVLVKHGNITIDASIERIIEMFKPMIVNEIYKLLPKAKV